MTDSGTEATLPPCPNCGAEGRPARGAWLESYSCGSDMTEGGVLAVENDPCERCVETHATRHSVYWHDDGEPLRVCDDCENAVGAATSLMVVRRAKCEPK